MEFISPVISSFLISLISIKVLVPIAKNIGLMDRPDERKQHSGHIPLVGGISIFLSIFIVSLIWLPDNTENRVFLVSIALMVFIGALDDKFDVSVKIRLVGQLLVATLMILVLDIYISHLGDLFNLGDINIGGAGILLTYIAVLGIINAFNMVDGIDGLLGCLSLNAFLSIGILANISGNNEVAVISYVACAALIPYLIFNLNLLADKTRKVFMGDSGSMLIGLAVVWLLTLTTQGDGASLRPVTALWICAIPLMDACSVIFRRIKRKQSPFKPNRDHLHHLLLNLDLTPRLVLLIISILSIFTSTVGLVGELILINESVMFLSFLITFVVYIIAMGRVFKN
jgi:UDP-GlcNAc:undecaprenyl-phosphate GlcNAc-1-phosphate transferase